MKTYQVKISENAKLDILEIKEYIEETLKSPASAIKIIKLIKEKILSLSFYPEKYQVIIENSEIGVSFRQLIVKNYRVIYTIEENVVIIVGVTYKSSQRSFSLN